MKFRNSLKVVSFVAILVVLLMLAIIDPGPPETNLTAMPPSDTANVKAESVESQVEENDLISSAAETTESQVTLPQDGSSLLQIHCAQCHPVRLLEQTSKQRADWERTLSRMERTGVRLSDTERSVLLDYLAVTDEP